MPIYIPKQEGEPSLQTPSISEFQLHDQDFIQDPDILYDVLPQPYRMIDKILWTIFELAWDKIEAIQIERDEDMKKKAIPKYENPLDIQELSDCECMCLAEDGLFVGLNSGFVLINQESLKILAMWNDQEVKIVDIKVAQITSSFTFILTLDELGICRLFIYTMDKFHIIKTLNEEPNSKIMISNAWVSDDAMAFAVQIEGNTGTYIEVYRSLKDTWLKEFDTALQQFQKMQQAAAKQEMTSSAQDVSSMSQITEETSQLQSQQSEEPASQSASSMVMKSVVFSKPTPSMRMRPPSVQSHSTNVSVADLFHRVETSSVIGNGTLHQLTNYQQECRKLVFEQNHEQYLQYLEPHESLVGKIPSIHFLTPGKLCPYGFEPPKDAPKYTSILLWWSDDNFFSLYSLAKPATKDLEFKADRIISFPLPITSVVVSDDNSLIAVGQSLGQIVVYDKYLGIVTNLLRASSSLTAITSMSFLPPCLFESDESGVIENGLLVCSKDGSCSLVRFRTAYSEDPLEFQLQKDESISFVSSIPGMPNVTVVLTSEIDIALYDTLKGKIICRLKLPEGFHLDDHYKPCLQALSNGSHIVFKAISSDEDVQSQKFLAFPTRSFFSLDSYAKFASVALPFTKYTSLENTIQSYLNDRLYDQTENLKRMKERWSQLKSEVQIIQNMRTKVN